MMEVHSAPNQAALVLAKSYLEANGIECEITNTILGSIAGDIPLDQTWPKLVIKNDEQEISARDKIKEFMAVENASELPSFCPSCDSEEIEIINSTKSIFHPKYRCKSCNHQWQKY